MNLLTSVHGMTLTGTPRYTVTLYNEMLRRGHSMTVYSPLGGPLASSVNHVTSLDGLAEPDIILALHIPCAIDLKAKFPNVPFVYYCHGSVQEVEQPPPFQADHYLVINEECRDNYLRQGIPAEKMTIVRSFVDTERFKPTKPINRQLQKILFISNYKKWKNYKAVSGACEKLGLELTCHGSVYGRNFEIEKPINEADMVIGWAASIMEGMACGRAALSWDRHEGDGYITPERYFEARKSNLSGRQFKIEFNADTLAEEMLKYDPDCGEQNRELIVKYHDSKAGTDQILGILNKFL